MQLAPYSQRGFTLIEALIAMLVVGFGMLAVVAMHLALARDADTSRQRGDAVRLAREKLEDLRTRGGAPADTDATDTHDLATARFERRWRLAADGASSGAWAEVGVAWTDRAGHRHHVSLRSVIDPDADARVAGLLAAAGATPVRAPRLRHVGVPLSAIDLGGGKSAYAPPGSANLFYVFDDRSGRIESECSGAPGRGGGTPAACVARTAHVLAGVVRFATDLPADRGIDPAALADPGGAAEPIEFALRPAPPAARAPQARCFSDTLSTTVRYACIVEASDEDGDAATPPTWSGQVVVTGKDPAWFGRYRLCRYSSDYDGDTRISNAEHPLYYRRVAGTLERQHYVVLRADHPQGCPTADDAEARAAGRPDLRTRLQQSQALSQGAPPWGGELSNGAPWRPGERGDELAHPMR